jgi:hypothetical protein
MWGEKIRKELDSIGHVASGLTYIVSPNKQTFENLPNIFFTVKIFFE